MCYLHSRRNLFPAVIYITSRFTLVSTSKQFLRFHLINDIKNLWCERFLLFVLLLDICHAKHTRVVTECNKKQTFSRVTKISVKPNLSKTFHFHHNTPWNSKQILQIIELLIYSNNTFLQLPFIVQPIFFLLQILCKFICTRNYFKSCHTKWSTFNESIREEKAKAVPSLYMIFCKTLKTIFYFSSKQSTKLQLKYQKKMI